MDAETIITEESEHDSSRPNLAGDQDDNDAAILDSLVESQAEPPTPGQKPTVRLSPRSDPLPITRLMTGSVKMLTGFLPIMLLPSDAKRKRLTIRVQSATAADYAIFSDDAGKVQYESGAAPCYQSVPLTLDDHTGPVWVALPAVFVGPMVVSFYAVRVPTVTE